MTGGRNVQPAPCLLNQAYGFQTTKQPFFLICESQVNKLFYCRFSALKQQTKTIIYTAFLVRSHMLPTASQPICQLHRTYPVLFQTPERFCYQWHLQAFLGPMACKLMIRKKSAYSFTISRVSHSPSLNSLWKYSLPTISPVTKMVIPDES